MLRTLKHHVTRQTLERCLLAPSIALSPQAVSVPVPLLGIVSLNTFTHPTSLVPTWETHIQDQNAKKAYAIANHECEPEDNDHDHVRVYIYWLPPPLRVPDCYRS